MSNVVRRVSFCCAVSAILFVAPWLSAADLDTNLIVNPGFENLNTSVKLNANSSTANGDDVFQLVGWKDKSGDSDDNYAAKYGQAYWAPIGKKVKLPGGGDYHYLGGFNTSEGEIGSVQTIDLDDGETAAASGRSMFYLNGYFSSVGDAKASTTLIAEFSNSAEVLGSAQVGGGEFTNSLVIDGGRREWGKDALCHLPLPPGTEKVEIQLQADGASRSGYSWQGVVDNVEFGVYAISFLPGDMDGDLKIGPVDADILAAAIVSGEASPRFDLTGDCSNHATDLEQLLVNAKILNGDLDFNGQVEFADFLVLSGNFGASEEIAWTSGDLVPNGKVNFADFLVLSQNFGKSFVADPVGGVEAIPEPSTGVLMWLGACLFGCRYRRSRNRRRSLDQSTR